MKKILLLITLIASVTFVNGQDLLSGIEPEATEDFSIATKETTANTVDSLKETANTLKDIIRALEIPF